MTYLGLFYLLFSLSAFSASSWQEEVKMVLPAPLKEFTPGKTKLQEVEKKLGKAKLVKGSKYYWEFEGFKYALELTIKSKTLKSMHFTFVENKPDLKILKDNIPLQKFTPFPKEGKSLGRYLKYQENGSELIIDPISKTIYSVRLP
jgi:hypothetical protein